MRKVLAFGSGLFQFVLVAGAPSIPPIKTIEYGPGNDKGELYVAPGELGFVDLFGGDDIFTLNFSSSVVDMGPGNDRLIVTAGKGRIMFMDESGLDTLELRSATSLSDVAVEVVGGWTYLGVKGAQGPNWSAAELDNVVSIQNRWAPEFVVVAGVRYSFGYIQSLHNSKPDFYKAPPIEVSPTFNGGKLADLPGVDPDDDALTYSVRGVDGFGSEASWWFEGVALHTNKTHDTRVRRTSFVTVSISDGKLHQDYPVVITWAPEAQTSTRSAPKFRR